MSATPAVSPAYVCKTFLSLYYEKIIGEGFEELVDYYQEEAQVTRRDANSTQRARLITGLDNIKEEISRQHKAYKQCTPKLDDVLYQSSVGGSIIISVTGSYVSEAKRTSFPFTQTFVLVPEEVKEEGQYDVLYSILNDLQITYPSVSPRPALAEATKEVNDKTAAQVTKTTQPSQEAAEVRSQEKPKEPVLNGTSDGDKATQKAVAESSPAPQTTSTSQPSTASSSWAGIAKSATESRAPTTQKPAAQTVSAGSAKTSAPAPAPAPAKGFTIHVKNLPYNVSEDAVRNLFSQFGHVRSVSCRENTGYGFVEFAEPRSVLAHILQSIATTPLTLQGRTLKVEEKKETVGQQAKRGGRGGRGGRGTPSRRDN